MFLMNFDNVTVALAGETGFPVTQLAAQKQMSINLVHVET